MGPGPSSTGVSAIIQFPPDISVLGCVEVPIPESRLDTWSNPGALTSSATAYNSIKTALASASSKVSALDYDAFLQGSYRNSTNIYGDSDVDIVVQLNSVFGKDGTRLDAEQRTAQQQAYTTATYNWADFRRDVLQTLEDYYGKPNVHPLKKCIQVVTGPGRITADVIPALEFRNYDYFYSAMVESHTTGVKFYDSAGIEIVNYPKLHIANGEAKNAADARTGGTRAQCACSRMRETDSSLMANLLMVSHLRTVLNALFTTRPIHASGEATEIPTAPWLTTCDTLRLQVYTVRTE